MAREKVFPWQQTDIRKTFQLGPCLGKGHLGHVRLVENLETGKLHVCKTILKERLQQKESNLAELMSEINGIRLVGGHPNIVELMGQFEDDEAVHLIMDLCSGGDLFDYIADRRKLPEDESAFIIRQLSSALRHCHSRGLVHRDIKPENILLCGRKKGHEGQWLPVVKLADFGMSIKLANTEKTTGVAGSLTYMAPEMVKQEDYSREIDIWSLGVVLYIALSGYVPFPGNTREEVFEATCEKEPNYTMEPWHLVSTEAKELVQWMLKKEAGDRPSASDILQHPWVKFHTSGIKISSSLELRAPVKLKPIEQPDPTSTLESTPVCSHCGRSPTESSAPSNFSATSSTISVVASSPGKGPVPNGSPAGGITPAPISSPVGSGLLSPGAKSLPPLHPSRNRNSPLNSSADGQSPTNHSPRFGDRLGGVASGVDPPATPTATTASIFTPFSSRSSEPIRSTSLKYQLGGGCTRPMAKDDESVESDSSMGAASGALVKVGIGKHSGELFKRPTEGSERVAVPMPNLSCVRPSVQETGSDSVSSGKFGWRKALRNRTSKSPSPLRPRRRAAMRSPLLSCAQPFSKQDIDNDDGDGSLSKENRPQEGKELEASKKGDDRSFLSFRGRPASGSGGGRSYCLPRRETSGAE